MNRRADQAISRFGSGVGRDAFPVRLWLKTLSRPLLLATCLLFVQGVSTDAIDAVPSKYEPPERLIRQVAPAPYAPWHAPDLHRYTAVLKSGEPSPVDPQKRYELVELIDLAQRTNPETRVAWEGARQAAISVGLVESKYYPVLVLSVLGGYQSEAFPAPKNVAPEGFFRANLERAVPALNLRWLLLDFGRRKSAMDAAEERLLAANLSFNRKHQEIVSKVQLAFYELTSLRAKLEVAQSSMEAARAVREAAEAQLDNGLATVPEVALARQQEAQALFDQEEVRTAERDAEVALAETIGIPPTSTIRIAEFSALPPPAALEESVEKVIDGALEGRPDLIAKVAALRGKEAEVRRARAAFFPTLSLVANVNAITGRTQVTGGAVPTGWFTAAEPSGGGGLLLEWTIFEGGAIRRELELAEAERRAAENEVIAARDRAVREIWKSYTDVRLAIRKLDVAAALVDASQKSYDASLESYRQGLGTIIDLLAARRELSRARFVEVDTRLKLYTASAGLAFGTGQAK